MTRRRDQDRFNILLATDFSKPAQRAYEYAMSLARPLHATLSILHVIKAAWPAEEFEPGSRTLKPLKTAALLTLGRVARLASEAGVRAETQLVVGNPVDRILHSCRTTHANLLVIGTTGRTGWDRLQFGSTAEALVREGPCPVLTVRETIPGDPRHTLRRLRIRRVLVATDLSVGAEAAVFAARNLAQCIEAELTIVHVVAEPRTPSPQGPAPRSAPAPSATRRLERLAGQFAQEGLMVHTTCLRGDPVERLLQEAARCRADLLVAGTIGRSGLPRVMLGSVAEELIRRAACPVLTVRHLAERRGSKKGLLCSR